MSIESRRVLEILQKIFDVSISHHEKVIVDFLTPGCKRTRGQAYVENGVGKAILFTDVLATLPLIQFTIFLSRVMYHMPADIVRGWTDNGFGIQTYCISYVV